MTTNTNTPAIHQLYEIWTDAGMYLGYQYGWSHAGACAMYVIKFPKTNADSIHARLSPKN